MCIVDLISDTAGSSMTSTNIGNRGSLILPEPPPEPPKEETKEPDETTSNIKPTWRDRLDDEENELIDMYAP